MKPLRTIALAALATAMTACATSTTQAPMTPNVTGSAPSPDPRIGLKPGLFDAGEAVWNLRVLSKTPPARDFIGVTNSDLAFRGNYVFQGNYNGYMVWDIANPRQPSLVTGYVCPASQSDVSVYGNLLFVSGEGLTGRLDCGTQGVQSRVSQDRLRGLRIFDISDIKNPKNVGNVQTCRGSHTHTVLVDPDDRDNIYVYISGSAGVRPTEELPGCVNVTPDEDPNSPLFRIEVIRVPLANPAASAIVSSPRIFDNLVAPPRHGLSAADIENARRAGGYLVDVNGQLRALNRRVVNTKLDSIMRARGGSGTPSAADSAALRSQLPAIGAAMAAEERAERANADPEPGPDQCHDITVYPAIGLAGGACEGYGLLLDISDPVNPRRIHAVADSNFSYWHSATFNNSGTKVLFSDEWGGGSQPKCRVGDPREWGANAIFEIENREMEFRSYYKLPAPQTNIENCVAHNGSLIPIPGRDVMVQAWYQGGISVFDWTDASRPYEIAFFDRGPSAADRQGPGGSWSVYWYNGAIVSSEISRGLDIFELVPSDFISQNEIDAANTVHLDYLNAQGQPAYRWPPSFALAKAYLDQLDRYDGLADAQVATFRNDIASAERATGSARAQALNALAGRVRSAASSARDKGRMQLLADALSELAK